MKKGFYLPCLMVFCFILNSFTLKASVPGITRDPRDTAACSGARVKFVVVDTGSATITNRWQLSTDGGFSWSNLTDTLSYSGTATDTLKVLTRRSLNGFKFRAIATNGSGADTSLAASLTVDTAFAGTITGSSAICLASSVTLTSSMAGGSWSRSNRLIDTVTPGGVVTGLARGFDTVAYTTTNTCGTNVSRFPIRIDTTVVALPILGPTVVCAGHSVTLSNGNVLGTWTWTSSNGNASVSAAGLLTGVFGGSSVISYNFTNGCNSVSSSVTVTVDTVLTPAVITGTNHICVGSWTHLTSSIGGGAWFSSSSAIAVVDGSGNVTGTSQGTAIISYYRSNGCGSVVSTDTVTVSAPASMIVGLDSVGIGFSRTYMDSVSGGFWTSSDTTIAKIGRLTGVVTGFDTGIVDISYTVSNFCGTTVATLTIHVGPPPTAGTITGATSVCRGTTISLVSSVAGGAWTISNGDTVVHATISATGVVSGLIAGQDTVYYTYTNGFGSATVSYIVAITTPPVIRLSGPASLAVGGNYFIMGTPAHGAYRHTNPIAGDFVAFLDSPTSGVAYGTIASYVTLARGIDTIHYRVTNACGVADSVFIIDMTIHGTNGISVVNGSPALTVYPNPTAGTFTINLESSIVAPATAVITNILGETVKEFTVQSGKPHLVHMEQPNGVYFISVTAAGEKYTSKITIAK